MKYNPIRNVMEAAYELLPYGKLSDHERNAIIASIRFTQATNPSLVKSWKTAVTFDKEGQSLYSVTIAAKSERIEKVTSILLESGALFTLVRTDKMFDGEQTITSAEYLFGSYAYHKRYGVSIEVSTQYDWNAGTGDMRKALKAAQALYNEAAAADPELVNWVVKNIARDECDGTHLIRLQNMLHNLAQ